MKKFSLILGAFALVLGLSQCTKQKPNMPNYSGPVGDKYTQEVTLTASYPQKNSKVNVADEGTALLKFSWEVGDKLQVGGTGTGSDDLTCTKVSDDGLTGTFTGTVTASEGTVYFNYGTEPEYTNQTGLLSSLQDGGVYLQGSSDFSKSGIYSAEMHLQYALLKLDLSALGTASGNDVSISTTSTEIAKVTGVTNADDNPYYVAIPADGTEIEYTFNGNSKNVKKTWTLNMNKYYTKDNGSGTPTGEPIVIELASPSGLTTTAGCNSQKIYACGGSVTLTDPQVVEFGLVYSSSVSVPEVGKANCDTTRGGTAWLPMGKTDFTVDLILHSSDTYKVRTYAIGDNGTVVYAPKSGGIKSVVGGNMPQAVEWNGGGTPGASPGVFTVASGRTVRFSQGNLQYIGSAATPYWKFAEHQFDYLGKMTGQNSTTTTVDRDLFGWGTSGYNGKNPYMTSSNPWDYPNSSNIAGTNYDWGVSNTIYAGEDATTGWRTLTSSEWNYLFKSRSNASNLYAEGKIGSCTCGVIILPDGWTWAGSVQSYESKWVKGPSKWSVTFTYAEWHDMEEAGAVFLPAAGMRVMTSLTTVASWGYYWSSSVFAETSVEYLSFMSNEVSPVIGDQTNVGCSVRLVR